MKKLSLQFYFLLVVGVITFNSCLKDDNDGPWDDMGPVGIMYFVNSYPDAQGLLYRLDGNVIGNPDTGMPMLLEYRNYSHPQLLYSGERKLEIFTSNDQEIVLDTTLTIEVDSGYTSFIFGTEENPQFAMTQDRSIEGLRENESGIRFLNFGEGVERVNLLVESEDEPLFTDRPVETGASVVENQGFQAYASGSHVYQVTDTEGNELAVRMDSRPLRPGIYYTIMLIGKEDDANTPLYIGVIEHR